MSGDVSSSDQKNVYRRQKRKKKNSRFFSNAKGFAKQGIYGRGTQIDDEQFKYFINILDTMKNGFKDVDDKVTMANNVFNQTQGKETYLSCNQIVCKVLESLIGFVNAEILDSYFQAFSDNFRPLCSDRFASHVLQKMVEIAFLRSVKEKVNNANNDDNTEEPAKKKLKSINNNLDESSYNTTTKFSNEHRKKCAEFLLRVSKFLLNNLEDFVWDPCANHIMRTCILSLAGIHVPKVSFEKGSTEIAKNRTDYIVPDEWHEVMKEYAQRLEMWPQFVDFPYQEHSSALLGVICLALKIVDKKLLKNLGKKILMESLLRHDANDNDEEEKEIKILNADDHNDDEKNNINKQDDDIKLPKVFDYQSSLLLLETLLEVAVPKLLTQLYAMLFHGRLATLARSSMTNFAVQKLLKRVKEKSQFESIFEELSEHLEELLQIGHTGVVNALTSTCLRFQVKQSAIATALQNALHVTNDKKSFFMCLIKLKPLDIVKQEESTHFVHLHGSLIIQDILKFNKPILLVNCMLETPAEQLVWIFNTPNGSHICDAFFESKYIGEKSREKLLRHLDGFYVDLAITKFGSRVVETCFDAAQDQQKTKIAKELVDKSNMVKGSPFGKTVYYNLRLETFRLSVNQWKSSLHQQQSKQSTKDSKTLKLFKDLIN